MMISTGPWTKPAMPSYHRFSHQKPAKDVSDYLTSIITLTTTVGRIMLVKPEKAKAVEDMLLKAAQSGQLSERVSDAKLVAMLDQSEPKKTTKISVRHTSSHEPSSSLTTLTVPAKEVHGRRRRLLKYRT